MPGDSREDYSYLSEFCHPNMMTFAQHYRWTTPDTIEFRSAEAFGPFGAIAGSAIQGLLALKDLLELGHETEIHGALMRLLLAIASIAAEGKHGPLQ